MKQAEKDILFAKADTLCNSIADPQLQTVMRIVCDVIQKLPIEPLRTLGFSSTPVEEKK